MNTFLTALIWGAGVSIGATLGIVGWFVAVELCKYLRGDTRTKQENDDYHERSLAELKRRNAIGVTESGSLQRIADALEDYAHIQSERSK